LIFDIMQTIERKELYMDFVVAWQNAIQWTFSFRRQPATPHPPPLYIFAEM
jgi:hypothetical protein